MAQVILRTWRSGPRKVKRTAYGYTLMVNGRQVRKCDAAWSRQDAQEALAAAILDRDVPKKPVAGVTLGAFAGIYLAEKAASGKRSIRNDRMAVARFKAFFGAEALLTEITAARIADFRVQRLTVKSERTMRALTKGSVNRDLSILRHLLRLAVERGELGAVPRIRMEREPQGRLRYLTEDEAMRLLASCGTRKRLDQSPHLPAIVTMAIHTGMRKGEIRGLTWERVDFARGVVQLEITKSGKRREVPMNRAVYDALSALGGDKTRGPVFRKADGRAWGNFRNAFDNAVTEAKLTDFRFHDLRHTFASWLVMRGRPLKEVQELLGHQSITMTMRYAHLSPDRLRDAVAALEDFSTRAAQSPAESLPTLVNARQN